MQILVLGMHRSGTSVVSRLLNMMGVYFAPEGVSNGANAENPKGFWERRDVRALNDMILRSAGADWHRLGDFSLEKVPEPNLAHFKIEAAKIILAMDAHRPWFLKEPRLCLLGQLWLELMEFPVCIFVHRSPLEVARSLQTRNGFSIQFGLALWERYSTAALDATRSLPRVAVSHSDLLADPVGAVHRLGQKLEELGVVGLRISSEAEILAFIDPSLYRAKESGTKGRLSKAQKTLRDAIESGEAFRSKKTYPFSARSRGILVRHQEEEEGRERIRSLEERNRVLLAEMATARDTTDRQLKIAKAESARNAAIAKPLVEAFQREMTFLRQELKGRADEVQILRRDQENVKLRQALVEARARIERDKTEAATAREQILGLRQALVEARARIERDKGEAVAAREKISELGERLKVSQREIHELGSQSKTSTQRISDLNHAIARRESLLASERARIEELLTKNKILQRGLRDIEDLFMQLRSSRSFHFMAYTARRLGLVSRTPRRTAESIKNLFSAIRKALKEVKSATPTETAAKAGGAGRAAPPPPSRAKKATPGRLLRTDDPALKAEVARATALRAAASGKNELRMPTAVPFPEPSVCFVVLHQAGADHLENLFSSFEKVNAYSNLEFNVVLHACIDRSREIIRFYQKRLRIHVTECTENFSFSYSNNRAVERTAAEYVVFLNNDIIFSQDVVPELVHSLQDTRTGLVGLRLLYPGDDPDHPGELQHAGIKFRPDPYFFFQRPFNLGAPVFVLDTPRVLETFPAVTGAFLACRRADFLRAGGFCEDYLYGYEDVDIALCFARLFGLRTVAANQFACLHRESGTGRLDQVKSIDERRLNNLGHLVRRHGWYLRRKIFVDKMAGKFFFSEKQLEVAFAVTEANAETMAGDFFSASELADACREEFGWNIRYLCRNEDWYDLSGVDVLVVLLDAYEPSQIRKAKPDLVKIGWLRNWFERWTTRPGFDQYDLFLCSSAKSAQWLEEYHRKPAWVFPLATNHARFAAGRPDDRWSSDYCFTGSFWQFERELASVLQPEAVAPFRFALYGSGWETHPRLKDYARGFIPYHELPNVYASTRIVVDDANHVTKDWASTNSRVFDALASGALVITNGEAGAAEIFEGELPVYRSPEELTGLLRRYLENEEERRALVDRLRQKVLSRHTYRHRARTLKSILITKARRSYRIGLKIAAPDRSQSRRWGDYHFAQSLGKSLAALGHSFRIDCLDEWDRPEAFGDDVVIVLRGLTQYRPKQSQINLIWNISHPDKIQDEEYEEFDHVFVASRLHAAFLAERLRAPVSSLLQCTDPNLFFPDPNPDLPAETLLFVGNSRKQDREAVRFARRAQLPVGVYGSDWEEFLPSDYLRGEHIENDSLRQLYSQCDILLNDHWPSMRERGFISNRLFDAAAAGAFVITDPVAEAVEVLGEELVVYRNESEFLALVEHYLAHPEERRRRTAQIRQRVLAEHTFAHRSAEIMATIRRLDGQKNDAERLRVRPLLSRQTSGEEGSLTPGARVGKLTRPATSGAPDEGRRESQELLSQSVLDQKPARRADPACLIIAIKTSVPNLQEAPAWGDHHFALALQRSFQALGHFCRIDMNPQWGREAAEGDDATLTLRGRHRYHPNLRHVNIMWNISHPDRVAPGEYDDFDHVFVASHSYARELAPTLGARVSGLLQCTDPGLFFPEQGEGLEVDPLLFVGNSRREYRRIVRDAVEAGLPVAVYGSLWEDFLPPGYLKGQHIENSVLRRYYSACKILLNDHWATMAESGFLSNRLFDAGACGACIISDRAVGMESVFGQSVLTYETPAGLKELTEYYLSHEEERKQKGRELREIVCRAHTFDVRARQIAETVLSILAEKKAPSHSPPPSPRRGNGDGSSATRRVPEKVQLNSESQWSSARVKFFLSQSEKIWSGDPAATHLRGWCFFLDGSETKDIRLRHGGACFEGESGIERPDVAKAFPTQPAALRSGFEISAQLPFLRKLVYLELKDEQGEWIPFHVREISSWRFYLKPFNAVREWLAQFETRRRVLCRAPEKSSFHRLLRQELFRTLDPSFWSALETSEAAIRAQAESAPAPDSLPLVSIIMPTYNRAALILQAIESVQGQSWSNWELHVCDDGSEDNTQSVVASLGDDRIKYHGLPHAGAASARNHGLASAAGRYIAYLDTDNVWHPDYLRMMVAALEKRSDAFTAYCKYLDTELDTDGRYRLVAYRDLPFDHGRLAAKNFIDLNGFVHRIEIYQELGGFTDRLIRLQDWDLAVRYTFYRDPLYVDQFLVIYRRNAKWDQLTTLHEYRIAPRQIVRQNIERLFLGAPDLSHDRGDRARVHAVAHGRLVSAAGFGTLVRALSRYCQLEMTIFGPAERAYSEGIFKGAQLSFQSEDSAHLPSDAFSAASVLLVLGCDDFALRIARRIHTELKVPIIVDDAQSLATGAASSTECKELSHLSLRHFLRTGIGAGTEAIHLAQIWDERVFRPNNAKPLIGANLSLLLDDYGLSPSEADEVRDQLESLPGPSLRVILLSSVFSKKDALNGSAPDQRPLSFRADAYLLWRSETSHDLSSILGLPFALALEIPILSNQDLSQIDAHPANFSRTVDWRQFQEVRAQMLALQKNPRSAAGLTAYGRRVFMRRFAASTVGRAAAIYCRIIVQARGNLELTMSLAAPSSGGRNSGRETGVRSASGVSPEPVTHSQLVDSDAISSVSFVSFGKRS